MHIHILGIGGTFMAGLAILAKAKGHRVTGSDLPLFPPMSTQLADAGIDVLEGYDAKHLDPKPDLVVIGNALTRGNPEVEAVLNQSIDFCSGPEWLYQEVLKHKWVIAVSGTHGKTSVTSLITWLLAANGFKPGYLIGGKAKNFATSAALGESDFFVIEADEYDTAFFDKRSKFLHYHPKTLVINNLEFDHADIFSSVSDIQKQFHHLIRTIPEIGRLIVPSDDTLVAETLAKGAWSEVQTFGCEKADWQYALNDGQDNYQITHQAKRHQQHWHLAGDFNARNLTAALAAVHHVGLRVEDALAVIPDFKGVNRRLDTIGEVKGIRVYDDFAHHPTAVERSIEALKSLVKEKGRVLAVMEPRSASMRMGYFKERLPAALAKADRAYFYQPDNLNWRLEPTSDTLKALPTTDAILDALVEIAQPGDHILVMSNGPFEKLHQRLLTALEAK